MSELSDQGEFSELGELSNQDTLVSEGQFGEMSELSDQGEFGELGDQDELSE